MRRGAYLLPADPSYPVLQFDAVLTETTTRDADITQFPVEQGADISDNYQVKLNQVKLEVFVSQEPIDPDNHPEGNGSFQTQTISWQPYPSPPILATVVTAIANPVGSILRNLNQQQTSLQIGALTWANKFNSLLVVLTQLEALRDNVVLVSVVTKAWSYDNMVLGQIETARDKQTGSGTRVSIELHEISTVATQQVAAPPVPKKPKDKTPVNKGAQQPQDPGNTESLAHKALSLLTGGA